MRILVTGGSGVLGRRVAPLLREAGHEVAAPSSSALDLFDPDAVREAVAEADAVLHLATRIPIGRLDDREAWRDNDRLRAEASRLLVDAALVAATQAYVQPTVPFLYPDGPADDDTPVVDPAPEHLRSVVAAEAQAARFAAAGRRGVVLRIGLLDGPGTGNDEPATVHGASLHVADAASALVLALTLPSGVYNATRDGERVANGRLRAAGWRPRH